MTEEFGTMAEVFKHAERRTQSTTLMGMVKPAEGDETHFMFSPTNCESWLHIPSNGVDSVEYLGQSACRKAGEEPHSHPLVRLRLTKQCMAELPYLTTLSAIIRQRQSPLPRPNRAVKMSRLAPTSLMQSASSSGFVSRLAAMPCFLVDVEGSIYVCCCDDNGDNCDCGGIG